MTFMCGGCGKQHGTKRGVATCAKAHQKHDAETALEECPHGVRRLPGRVCTTCGIRATDKRPRTRWVRA